MMPRFISPLLGLARRFRRNRRASAAIEFALVAPMFFALLFAIIETSLIFFADQVLETAVQDSARLILTGQAQTASMSQSQFKTQICNRVSGLFNCAGIYVDVESYSSFSSINLALPIDANKNFVNNMQYSPGGSGDIVVVRAYYQWPLYVTGLGYNIMNLAGNMRLLSATAAFRNEPYSS